MAKKKQKELVPTSAPKKLFLLDGMALIYRAHFALIRSPRFNSREICTSGVFGFCNTLLEIINKEEPTHIAVVFDTSAPTFRHEVYPEYKANRDAMPEDLSVQIPLVFRLVEAMNIPLIRIDGVEADDVIGTLARDADADGNFETFMVTPDKDFHQLVTESSFIFRPGRRGGAHEILKTLEVLEQWQVERVEQVIDILGLMGDSSDNVPGVPGIGPKTAQKLIAQFDNINNLLENTGQLKGKQKERLEENADQARLSRDLVTIRTNVEHEIELEALEVQKRDDGALKELFVELEFDGLGKRVFGRSFTAAPARAAVIREKREKEIQARLFDDEEPQEQKNIEDTKHDYQIVQTAEQRAELIAKLEKQEEFCFDTETTGLDPREALPLGMAFSYAPQSAFYVVIPPERSEAIAVMEEFRGLMESETVGKVGHNLKYDITLLKWHGIEVRGTLLDTMLAHSMKEPEMSHGLDYLANLYLGYKTIPTSDLIGPKGPEQKNMSDVPLARLAEYACEDADITLQVANVLRPDIEERGVEKVCYEVECPLVPVLVDMEHEGIRLDVEAINAYSVQLAKDIEELKARIFEAAGREFNVDSPKQLGVILFDEMKIDDKPKKTATGQYSTREAELLRLSGKHQIVEDILDYRNAAKLKSVYVDQLPHAVNPETGRLHTHYSQTWTATGRMQSNNPNLQTIPVRKERGREIRAAFVPRDGEHLILAADYSQIELRIMAELSGDESMMEAFVSETDIHRVTASKVFKVDPDDVTRTQRDQAKTVNFGIIYGISAFGLQQRLNIPRKEASSLINNYFAEYPGVQDYIDRTIEFAQDHGYVRTLTGRRRYLRDINSRSQSMRRASERLAMNSPIQGTAADMLKLAMIKVHKAIEGFRSKMLLTVHDELVFDLFREEEDEIKPIIKDAMQGALELKVPIVVEMGVGKNWLEAH
ncbi:MAG: DNA polymerase I [Planctomycetota bacterium]